MKVFVTGADGFIGRHLLVALRNADCDVLAGVRRKRNRADEARILNLDLAEMNASQLAAELHGVDCIVNLAGVFADGLGQSTRVNDSGASVLFRAAEKAGVRRVVHFSALGVEGERTPFARTKLAGERALMSADVDWVILRPSIVLGATPSGSGALIRGLAALPFIAMEKSGAIDVVRLDDVIDTVVRLVTTNTPGHRIIELVGPDRMQFSEVVATHRAWLGWPKAREVEAPRWLMSLGYLLGDIAGWLGWRSPVRSTARAELRRGATGDGALLKATTGLTARPLAELLRSTPATLQDRRFAQFYFLKPIVIAVTAVFWLGTGVTSLTIGYDIGVELLQRGGMGALSGPSVIAGGWADILIGLGVLFRPTARMALWGAIVISLFYAIAGTALLPELWRDPIGPMLKIWPLIVLNVVALFLVRDR